MPENSDIYDATVRLLRDVSRNHAAAAADICSGALDEFDGGQIAPAPAAGPPSREVEDLGAMLHELEDVGVSAVCRLARVSDDGCAFAAIDDADAGWLRAVILNRAIETAAHRGTG
jgi:hypothetical protein